MIDYIEPNHKTIFLKLFYIKRKTRTETRYHKNMGELTTRVIYIKRFFVGLPIKTMQKYRETYNGRVKSCEDCMLYI
ncbi:MAG: hypothetical protein ACI9XP_000427 [Lentimonas sp.]|jgi:hypothetical protein